MSAHKENICTDSITHAIKNHFDFGIKLINAAKSLGLQSPRPFLVVNTRTDKSYEGFNYASGLAGIRSETGTADHVRE